MTRCALLLLWLSLTAPGLAADAQPFPTLRLDDVPAMQEATRVLEEELKLAARPQSYLLIDLVENVVLIKARGIPLHRIPMAGWSLSGGESMTGVFRLTERPPVVRRKINPTATAEQEPISLADMPVRYELTCAPSLTLDIRPSAEEYPWQWTLAAGRTWWRQLRQWSSTWLAEPNRSPSPSLHLTLSSEHARSLAWSLVDDMPLIIRRPLSR